MQRNEKQWFKLIERLVIAIENNFCKHNYFPDDKQFPKYVRCSKCGHRRLFKGGTIEEK